MCPPCPTPGRTDKAFAAAYKAIEALSVLHKHHRQPGGCLLAEKKPRGGGAGFQERADLRARPGCPPVRGHELQHLLQSADRAVPLQLDDKFRTQTVAAASGRLSEVICCASHASQGSERGSVLNGWVMARWTGGMCHGNGGVVQYLTHHVCSYSSLSWI